MAHRPQPADAVVLRELAARVLRAFYPPRHILIVDALLGGALLRDEDLAKMLSCQRRQARSLCARLRDDYILRHVTIKQPRPGRADLSITRNYYLIDWPRFVAAVKFRMMKIRQSIDDELTRASSERGYQCPVCKSKFDLVDALQRQHPVTRLFLCSWCPPDLAPELTMINTSVEVDMLQLKLQKWTDQTQVITHLLHQTDHMELPVIDEDALQAELAQEVQQQQAAAEWAGEGADALLFAKDSGLAGALTTIHVDIQDDAQGSVHDTVEGAEISKKANGLPVWMRESTVDATLAHTHTSQSYSTEANRTLTGTTSTLPHIKTEPVQTGQMHLEAWQKDLAAVQESRGSKRASPVNGAEAYDAMPPKKIRLENGRQATPLLAGSDIQSDGDDEDEFEEVV